MPIGRKPVGELFLERGAISADQLKRAIEEQVKTGEPIGKVLVKLGFISEDQLVTELSKQLNIPYVNLMSYEINKAVTRMISEGL